MAEADNLPLVAELPPTPSPDRTGLAVVY